jgi:hypothetical protein
LTSTQENDGVNELIGMINGKDNRSMARQFVSPNYLNVPKKDTQDGMKKDFDRKV